MKIRDFTVPELNMFRELCNFTDITEITIGDGNYPQGYPAGRVTITIERV